MLNFCSLKILNWFLQFGSGHLCNLLDAHKPVSLSSGQQSGALANGNFYHGEFLPVLLFTFQCSKMRVLLQLINNCFIFHSSATGLQCHQSVTSKWVPNYSFI